MSSEFDRPLPGRRVPRWEWLQRIEEAAGGRGRLDQRTRKRKVKRRDVRLWRRREEDA